MFPAFIRHIVSIGMLDDLHDFSEVKKRILDIRSIVAASQYITGV